MLGPHLPAPPLAAYCTTTLNYARGEDQVAVPVTIHDARAATDLPFADCGFTLLRHRSAVSDWRDEAEIAAVHEDEVEALALEVTGCDQTMAYPGLVRSPATAARIEDYAPIEFVHSDFTEDYGPMLIEDERPYRHFLEPLLMAHGLSVAAIRDAERVMLLQFWRNTGAQVPDRPLAFCDARTTPRSDLGTILVPEYGERRLDFQTFYAEQPDDPARHHWYTFPALGDDEVVAFRTYDSARATSGDPFWTLHSAFVDPTAGADAPLRESVEMRVLCLWGV